MRSVQDHLMSASLHILIVPTLTTYKCSKHKQPGKLCADQKRSLPDYQGALKRWRVDGIDSCGPTQGFWLRSTLAPAAAILATA